MVQEIPITVETAELLFALREKGAVIGMVLTGE
jgi:hypothetical protein